MDGWTRQTLQTIIEKLDLNLISFKHAKSIAGATLRMSLSSKTRQELIKEIFAVTPTLPTMETVAEDRAAAASEAAAVILADRLRAPLPSISRITGDIETRSPLFRESDANPQKLLF